MELKQDISDNKALSCSVLVLWRGAERQSSSFSDVFLWWKTEEKVFGASSFNKRCFLLIWGLGVVMHLPAGHGGEGEMLSDMATFSSGGLRGDLKRQVGVYHMAAMSCCHDPMAERRPLLPWMSAAGEKDLIFFCRHLVLFNLLAFVPLWRPFDSDAVCSRRSTPSGYVPGGFAADRARRWQELGGGGAERRTGLDCVSIFCPRVFSAKFRGVVVIFFIFEVLNVICTPPTKI